MTISNNPGNEGGPGEAIDELGHRAGAALRSQPADPRFDSIKARGDRARRRITATVAGVGIATVAVIGGVALMNQDDSPEDQAIAATPSSSEAGSPTALAATTTIAPTTTLAATTTVPPTTTIAASVLLDAGLLPSDSMAMVTSTWPLPLYTKEWASGVPECQAYLDFFDAPEFRSAQYADPATLGQGAMFVEVWPSATEAEAAMTMARSAGFDECWAAFHDSLNLLNTNGAFSASSYGPLPDPVLDYAGDESVPLGIAGPVTAGAGITFDDSAYTPVVRVGRVVFGMNFAVPADDVQSRVEQTVGRLRAAGA